METLVGSPKFSQWKRKRDTTFAAFCVIAFGLGLEYSLVFPSLWFYYENIIKTKHAKVFYGSALSAYPLGSILAAFTIGKYVDKTRKAKRVLVLSIILEIIGNTTYTLYYSPWFPLLGRLICGFCDVCNMVMAGEIARSFESKVVTTKFSYLITCFSFGFIVAPGANIFFCNVHVDLNGYEINSGNAPGILLASLFSLILVTTVCFVHDLSGELDLKDHFQEEVKELSTEMDDMNCLEEITSENSEKSHLLERKQTAHPESKNFHSEALKSIIKCPDLMLLLAFCFTSSYVLFSFDTLLSLVAAKYFGFNVKETSIMFIGDGIVYSIVLLILSRASKRCSDYHAILFAFCVLISGVTALLILSVAHKVKILNYILLGVYLFSFSTTWTIEEVLTRSLFSKMVPSWCQSYSEGVRRSVSSSAFIIAGVTASGLFDYLMYLSLVVIIISIILMGLFIKRRKNLIASVPLF